MPDSMKIDPLSSLRTPSVRRTDSARSGRAGGFAQVLSEETVVPSSVSGSGAIAAVDALFALQEVPDPTERRRQARRRGEELLDRLDELRLGLLNGWLPRGQIERLAELARTRRERSDDPRLNEILAEIELRALVELAKLEAAGGSAAP